MNPQNFNLTKAAYSVGELIELVPLGRNSIYEAVKKGALKVTKFGRRTMFLAPHVAEFLTVLSERHEQINNKCHAPKRQS